MKETKLVRCAIYVRKSTNEGLDQEYSSIDYQIHACKLIIESRKALGWELEGTPYSDPGFSAGSLDRPALQQLMEDVRQNKVDTIIIYKLDRLTRSLFDFPVLFNLFEEHDVAFFSVSESFDTTTAAGRLSLHAVLMVSEYQREDSKERVLHKIAASKKLGMWMGGYPPIGYDIINKKLIINEDEAKSVRYIFERYLQLKSVTLLCLELKELGFLTKRCHTKTEKILGGKAYTKTQLYKLFHNPVYTGKVRHKDDVYEGIHEGIISDVLWQEVQSILKDTSKNKVGNPQAATEALLRGLIFTSNGYQMTPTHCKRRGRRYRYYITHNANKKSHSECDVKMVRAGEVEGIVFDHLKAAFRSPEMLFNCWENLQSDSGSLDKLQIQESLINIDDLWDHLFHNEQAKLVQLFIDKVIVSPDELIILIRPNGIANLVSSIQQVEEVKRIYTHDNNASR